jgi:hypothetical protein
VPTAEIDNEYEYIRKLNKLHLSEFIVGLLHFFKKLQSSVTVEIPHPYAATKVGESDASLEKVLKKT